MNGIIFFEDGTVTPFGTLTTVQHIAKSAQRVLPQLIQNERDQILATVTKEELRSIAERLTKVQTEE